MFFFSLFLAWITTQFLVALVCPWYPHHDELFAVNDVLTLIDTLYQVITQERTATCIFVEHIQIISHVCLVQWDYIFTTLGYISTD